MPDLSQAHPVLQALLGGLFTWTVTALGAALVFANRRLSQKLEDRMLGFAAGVMIAASFWSLLAPAVELSEGLGIWKWVPPVVGFLSGGVVLRVLDNFLPHLHPGLSQEEAEGVPTAWQRSTLLVLAITLHNIPEGLAVGVAFGGSARGLDQMSLASALTLTFGIGLQNFPEGCAVALPLRLDGMSRGKAFWYGQLSGFVEPVAAVLGAAAVTMVEPILPYALAFAAGAMIYVVVEELIPSTQRHGNTDIATTWCLAGFALMMGLDVGLG